MNKLWKKVWGLAMPVLVFAVGLLLFPPEQDRAQSDRSDLRRRCPCHELRVLMTDPHCDCSDFLADTTSAPQPSPSDEEISP